MTARLSPVGGRQNTKGRLVLPGRSGGPPPGGPRLGHTRGTSACEPRSRGTTSSRKARTHATTSAPRAIVRAVGRWRPQRVGPVERVVQRPPASIGGVEGVPFVYYGDDQLRPGNSAISRSTRSVVISKPGPSGQIADRLEELPICRRVEGVNLVPFVDLRL